MEGLSGADQLFSLEERRHELVRSLRVRWSSFIRHLDRSEILDAGFYVSWRGRKEVEGLPEGREASFPSWLGDGEVGLGAKWTSLVGEISRAWEDLPSVDLHSSSHLFPSCSSLSPLWNGKGELGKVGLGRPRGSSTTSPLASSFLRST